MHNVSSVYGVLLCLYVCFIDFPGILSGESLAFLDPHEACFTHRTRGRTSSYMWKLSDPELRSRLRHQIEPFLFDLFESQRVLTQHEYDSTVFRFPLRQDAAFSELSQTVYSQTKVENLFSMFEKEVHNLLLFLTNVRKIEVWEKNGANSAPFKVMEVCVDDAQVLEKRARFKQTIEPFARDRKWMPQELSATFEMQTTFRRFGKKASSSTHAFLVSQFYDGGSSSARNFIDKSRAKYLPWMGIALPLSNKKAPRGQMFCFLPLPPQAESPTGFKFHVNGFFSVSQDRCAATAFQKTLNETMIVYYLSCYVSDKTSSGKRRHTVANQTSRTSGTACWSSRCSHERCVT